MNKLLTPFSARPVTWAITGLLGPLVLAVAVHAQEVSVYVYRDDGGASRRSGQVSEVSPEGLKLDGEMITADQIKKISVPREPSNIDRARDHLFAGRYGDGLEELKKIDEMPTLPLLVQEVEFIQAYCTAQVSLQLGTIDAAEAGREVQSFLNQYPNSFHLYPLLEQYGQLIFAFGRPELAAQEFAKLKQAGWVEYRLKGFFNHGRMQEVLGNLDQAVSDYDAILGETGTDDATQQYQLLAACEKAKLVGLQGDPESAVRQLLEMVQKYDSDNEELFGYLYNALGAVYEKAGRLKEARTAYMHTQLLFASESRPHAEAMYRLSLLWRQLEDPTRANDSRELLKTRYRNSYWAQQL